MNSTSISLLDRAKKREETAWQRLVELYTPLVYVWCRRSGLQPSDAADIGQEVFQAVARKLEDFQTDREGDTFRGWLRIITRNKVNDYFDKQRTAAVGKGGSELQPILTQPFTEQNDSAENLSEDRRVLYQQALELMRTEFEEKTWKAFSMVVMEDQAPEEVARVLGQSVNAVYLAKSRVLRRLRDEFSGLLEDVREAQMT